MNTWRLFGGLDLKLFQTEGKIEYLVENSFMNQEYVIFEELFDSPDYILEQLKDVLSSKQLRMGNQIFPLKTKFIICNTNKERSAFTKLDSSLLALMERFPLELEVKWKAYNKDTYGTLLNQVNGFADPLLVYILDEFASNNTIISPRIALETAEVLKVCGPNCFEFIADFANKKDLLTKAMKKFKAIEELMHFKAELENYSAKMTERPLDSLTVKELKELVDYHAKVKTNFNKMKKSIVDDKLLNQKADIQKQGEKLINEWEIALKNITADPTIKSSIGEPVTPADVIDSILQDVNIQI